MENLSLFYRFGAALAIGFLIGLQREYAHGGPEEETFAGVRTFSLIALVGCTGALLADELTTAWTFIAILLILGLLIAAAHFVGAWRRGAVGLTTEAAALLTALAGALCYWDYLALAAAIGVATMVLLSLKPEMHALAGRITRADIYATLKFAVITVIVLPVLPNRSLASPPFDVLNPYRIWLMVVFISGISFLGYVLIKVLGPRHGITLTGLLGGFVSSTPATVSFSRRSQKGDGLAKPLALAVTVAWSVTFFRILVEVGTLNIDLLRQVWPPLVASAVVGLAYCVYLYFLQRTEEEGEISYANPFELGTALQFGLLYGVVLLVSRVAQIYLGDTGIYISSIVSGFADTDAVTLTIAELSKAPDGPSLVTASQALVLGAMANTVTKGVIVFLGGSRELRRATLPSFGLMLATGLGMLLLT